MGKKRERKAEARAAQNANDFKHTYIQRKDACFTVCQPEHVAHWAVLARGRWNDGHASRRGGREDEGQRHRRIHSREEELNNRKGKKKGERCESFVQRTAALGYEEKERGQVQYTHVVDTERRSLSIWVPDATKKEWMENTLLSSEPSFVSSGGA